LKDTTAQKASMENELQVASGIQMSMLPSKFPDREGLDMYASMTPAKEVGGDLYNYLLKDDGLYFCLGDVSGKGVPASLFMAQVTRLFRTLANQQMAPADICTHMNEALSGDENPTNMFVTIFVGLVDLQSGHLSFCNAGHNPPVIGGGEHHGDFLNMLPNFPIGVMPGLQFQGEEIDNIKGRPLFIYTDGLNEAENREYVQFGDDHLLDILRNTHFDTARQVVETLAAEVERHRDGADPNDDLTMMCLRIN
jgi:sigma-B regulation protein RsbU (phosphoserine phosphatase)